MASCGPNSTPVRLVAEVDLYLKECQLEKSQETTSMCGGGSKLAVGAEIAIPTRVMHAAIAQLQYEDAERRRVLRSTLAALADLLFPSSQVDPHVHLYGRVKSITSTTEKMAHYGLAVDQVLDIIGIRAITRHTSDCYRLANRIHSEFEVVENEYDDYIAAPKANGYRSLHTTVTGLHGFPVEIQIRTPWMHMLSESGSASHRRYKRERTLWMSLPSQPNRASVLADIKAMTESMKPLAYTRKRLTQGDRKMAMQTKNNGSKSKKDLSNSSARSKDSVVTLVPQNGERQKMVSEAAYFRAVSRKFEGGDPVEDWLEAEKEIGSRLSSE